MELAKLEKILEYQRTDMEVYKMEKELNQSDEVKMLQRCKKTFDEKKNMLLQLHRELDEAFAQIAALDIRVEAVKTSQDESAYNPDKKEELSELIAMEKEFAKYEAEVDALGKELSRLIKKINDIGFYNKRINEEMQAINAEYQKINRILSEKKETMLKKARPILKKLQELIPELDKKYYEKYAELRKEKKMPAFVVYNEGSCGGCGMDISIEVKAKLVNVGDVTECPHCGRVVYKKK